MSESRNTYWALIAIAVAGLALTLFITIVPVSVDAFWPFASAKAQGAGEPPVLHDSTLALLDPATNIDPNPSKGATDIEMTSGSALLANSGPDGSLPGASVGGGGAISVYQVREGDSLSGIADMFGVSTNTILWANDIKDPKTIHAGDELIILPVSGVRYTVKKGGTLSDIAKLYDADVSEIAIFNGLDESATLAAGDTIIIPGAEQHTTASSKPASGGTKKPSSGGSTSVATSGFFRNPVPGGLLTQNIHGNNAVDIGAPSGTPIYAAAGGTVIISKGNGAWNGGYGSYVVITHSNGTQTLYAHMSKDVATVGAKVSAGDVIGYVGRTGEATGNHLHFEVRGGTNPFKGCATMKVCTFK